MPIFRNDDVSPETNIDHYKEFCSIFHHYGYLQLHGITVHGWTHDRTDSNGNCSVYPGEIPITEMSPQQVIELSKGKEMHARTDLIKYINSIPDPIALHGPFHYDYTRLSHKQQEEAIRTGLQELALLFPKKTVRDFIPPFNRYNDDTVRICRQYGLTLHDDKGTHLEAMIHYGNQCALQEDVEYRYHHHRFYDESPFTYYDLSLRRLYRFFMETAPQRPILSHAAYEQCVEAAGAQKWYSYAWKNFEKFGQCYYPYYWIRENISREKKVVETGCGAGGVLHMLWHEGFIHLYGYDYDSRAVAAGRNLCAAARSGIIFTEHDCTQGLPHEQFDVILGMNWIYLLENFGLRHFLELYLPSLASGGYFVFDVIDTSFNGHPLNQWCTQDWKKAEQERRPSEYNERFSCNDIKALAHEFGLEYVQAFEVPYIIPRNVCVLKKIRAVSRGRE